MFCSSPVGDQLVDITVLHACSQNVDLVATCGYGNLMRGCQNILQGCGNNLAVQADIGDSSLLVKYMSVDAADAVGLFFPVFFRNIRF